MACTNGVHGECSTELKQKIDEWLKWDQNAKTRHEIETLVDQKQWSKLEGMLLKRLAFGTAGLRGAMRAGFASMNDLVVIQTAQGLVQYIKERFPSTEELLKGVVYGYDGRHNSKRFVNFYSYEKNLCCNKFIYLQIC